jgi:tetratricopeptide (TPR) repeat protein
MSFIGYNILLSTDEGYTAKMHKLIIASICLLSACMTLPVSRADAKVPDRILQQKSSVVTVYVDDKNGRHVTSGSGFILDKNGTIATNCAVVAKWFAKAEHRIRVETEGGAQFPLGDLISPRCENNLALINVEAVGLPAVVFNANYGPKKGEKILLVRKSSGPGPAVSEGTVKDILKQGKLIRTSISITPQYSGSPVFNMKGEAIGASVFMPDKGKLHNVVVLLKDVMRQLENYKKRRPRTAMVPKDHGEIIKKEGSDANEYFILGCSYESANRYHEAIEAYKQSVQMNPSCVEAYMNLGVVYYKIGNYTDAIEVLRQALAINPYVLPLYNKLGTTYLIRGTYPMAIDAFKKAVEIDSNNASAHYNLGIAYFLAGDKTSAFEEYIMLKDIDNEKADALRDIIMN